MAAVRGVPVGSGDGGRGSGRVSLYVDASAWLKLYFDEPDSARAEQAQAARALGWLVLGS